MSDASALGISLSSFNFGIDADLNVPLYLLNMVTPTADMTDSVLGIKAGASITNASLTAGITGLKSKVVSDVKAAINAKADVAYSVNASNSTSAVSVANSANGVYANAYLANGSVYVDLSDANLVNLINSAAAANGTTSSSITAGKYVAGKNVITADNLPLMSADVAAEFSGFGTMLQNELVAYKDYIETYSYANGDYAVNINLSKDKITALVANVVSSMSSEQGATVSTYAAIALKFLNIDACQATAIFNDSGVKSVATNIKVGFDTTLGEIMNAISPMPASYSLDSIQQALYNKTEKLAFNLSFKIDVLQGDAVSVVVPSDDELAKYSTESPVKTSTPVAQ
jgi:hypothetical protein